MALVFGVSETRGEEPYQRFLDRLRNEKLFDLALVYLSDLEANPYVTEEYKTQIPLERGILFYNAAAVMSAKNPLRAAKLDKAEQAMREFLQQRKQHPRRGEAQLTLGNLLLIRAEEARQAVGPEIKQDVADAIKFYTSAHELFEETIKELAAILENIKGARTDAGDTQQIEYRNQVRGDVRRAQLYSASSIENRGRSRVPKSADWSKDLEQAMAAYTDLYLKSKESIAIQTYALFYRSGIQDALGKTDDAIDGYMRILDQEIVDELRTIQTESLTKLLPLLATQGKFPIAVERGDRWDGQIRPDERQSQQVLDMRLALNRVKLQWIQELEKKDKDDRVASKLKREAREQVRQLARIPGTHQDDAKKLLPEFGVEVAAKEKTLDLPKVKNLAEAITAATDRIQTAETTMIEATAIKQKLAEPNISEADKTARESELAAIEEQSGAGFEQAVAILQDALQKHSKKAEREQIYDARQKLAYSLLKNKQPWPAIALSEFLAYSNPRTETGLQAGAFALAGYGELLKSEDQAFKNEVTATFQPFAAYLASTWPESEEASLAARALVQLALIARQYDKAEEYLKLIPTGSPAAAKVLRDASLSFYKSYLDEKRAGAVPPEQIDASRKRAVDALQKAVAAMAKDSMGSEDLDVINALARTHLAADEMEAASKLLSGDLAPVAILKEKGDSIAVRTGLDSYRTALQVEISRLASGAVTAEVANKTIGDYVAAMETVAQRDASAAQLVEDIYVQLSRETKELLSATKMPDRRKKLAEALIKVAGEAGKKADSFNTKYWAAGTLLDTAEQNRSEAGVSQAAAAEAAVVLDGILTKSAANPEWLKSPGLEINVKLLLAKSQRAAGKFEEAIESFASILQKKNSLVDVQMEAARTLQFWGDSAQDLKHFKAAIEGTKRGPTGANQIWGFGKLADLIANKPNLQEQFFEARFELANSRYKYARLAPPEKKNDYLKQTARDLTSTAQLYSALSNSEKYALFDTLLKTVQKEMGEEPVGLSKK